MNVLNWFELGRLLYEARIKEAWSFTPQIAQARLDAHPYPRHPADADPRCNHVAEIELAQAQAKALLGMHVVTTKE